MLREEIINCLLFFLQYDSTDIDINKIMKYLKFNNISDFNKKEIVEILNYMFEENFIEIKYKKINKDKLEVLVYEKNGIISETFCTKKDKNLNKIYLIANFGYERIEFLDEIFNKKWIIPELD